ncbi:MAG: RHS repeat-associated core domain-containing protein, partial [Candidatus Omnitrophota bacterium]
EDVEVCSEYPYSPWQPFTGNFNADKYTDFALYNKDSGEVKIALGTGSGFKPFTTWLNVSDSHKDSIALAGDFNGDSLADLLLFNKSTGETRVLFSNTKEFVDESDWTPSGFSVKDKDLILSDFNNDGLTDIGYWDKASSKWYYAVSKGDKFAVINNGIWLEGFGSKDAESASTGDFNGDGLTDAAVFDKEELGIKCWSTRASTNKPADLLTDIINGIGGKTKVTYSYASSENQDYLPFPVYVTSSVSSVNTVPVERQASYTQNFSYTGGFFDAAEREFRGFHYVKVTDPITQNYTQTQFYQGREDLKQDGALKGQIEQVEAYDGNSRLISRVENKYTVAKEGREDKAYLGFPALTKQITTVNEENNQYIKTENTFSYDAIGNPLEQSNDITEYSSSVTVKPGSKKTTQTTYAQAYTYNTVSKSGLNRPLQTALLDKDNKEVSKKSFSYDSKGNLLKEKVFIFNPFTADYGLSTVDYTYDSFGNLITTTNTKGHQVTTEYETKFYAFPVKVTNALGQSISYTYDPKLGVVLSVTDTNNATTTSHYDSLGRLLYAENALGQVPTRYEYPDPNFNRKITKQLDLKTGEYVEVKTELIDGLGRKYRTITVGEDGDKAKNVVSETFYNERGLVDRESLPHYEIDTADQISQIVYVRYVYDIRGRITKTYSDFSPSSPSPTARYYPAFEQQFSPEGKDATAIINYGPNDSSPLYTETLTPDPEHNQEHKKGTLKDIYGNVLEVTEFTRDGDFKTKYEYDIQNNLVKVIDSQGQDKFTRGKAPNITQIFYDSVGRKIKMLDPDMGEWSYEYDLLGNLIRQTDAKGQALEFEYDALNRLVRKYANPVPGTPNPEASGFRVQGSGGRNILATYIYDDPAKENCIGRLSKVVDQSGSTEFFYDVLGREIKSIKSLRGGVAFPVSLRGASAASDEAISYTVQREYDLFDRLTKLTYPDGEAVSYTYDTNSGLPEKVFTVDRGLSTVDYVSDITYNAKGQIKNIQYGNNTKTDYTYGQDLRLEHILTQKQGLSPQGTVPVSGAALQDLYYDFDSNGNLSTLTDNLRSNTRAYRYDDLDRLTEAQNSPIPNGGLGTFRYEYDSIGNMRSQTVSGTATVFMDYGQNAGPHALTSSAGYSYRYDQNGNMIQGKNKTLEYDAENRLTQVTEGSTITSFSYDGDGGRVKKSTVHSQQSTETTYIGSLFEIDSSGKTTKHIFAGANRVCSIEGVVSVKALTSRGVVPDAQRLSPPTQMPAPASTQASTFPRQELRKASSEPKISYYHSDHLGSSNVISDKDGALVQKIEYAPYGAIASTEPRTPNPVPKYLYTGKELDGTGLYYYGARYYDPEIGRFITPDTIVQAPYDPQSFNRYSYCRNNPINYIDPTGHKWSWGKFWSSFVGAVLGVIVTAVTGGLGAPFWLAGMYGGMAGGALTGGLQGGWQGALMGAAIGGVLGAAGGWAAGGGHYWAMAGMFAAGVGVAAATNSWDSFAGGIAGAAVGTLAGAGILSAYKEQFGNFRAGDGFRSNAAVKNINAQKALQVDIKKGYNDLKNTRWAKTEDGKAVVRDVGKAINKGDVTLENLPPGTRADYLNGKIRLNSQNSQAEIPGRLVHEGTHMLQDQRGELGVYDFPDERAAFNAGYAVDQETNVYGAYNPTDNEIRTWYKPYFDI